MIHKVRNPFYCRKDQFLPAGYPGQVLVVGILASALTGDIYRMTIGKQKDKVYEAETRAIKMTAQKWINKKGQTVMITPVDLFIELDRQQNIFT